MERTLPDFREVGAPDVEDLDEEQQREVWRQGRQLLDDLKEDLLGRMRAERARIMGAAAGGAAEGADATAATGATSPLSPLLVCLTCMPLRTCCVGGTCRRG